MMRGLLTMLALWAALAAPVWADTGQGDAKPGRGEVNYAFLCAQCHGERGDATGPNASRQFEVLPADLTDGQYMSKFTDQQIFRTLTYGGPANNLSTLMPPWGNRLSEDERWELIRLIRVFCNCKGISDEAPPAPRQRLE